MSERQDVISVIIVNHNDMTTIGQCLEALFGAPDETLRAAEAFEVIVVDNASSDGSARFIAEHFPQVRLICRAQNKGFGHGNNVGARQAIGDYLIFLNPDVIVTPGWPQALLDPLAADPTIGMTTAKILLADNPDQINACGNDMHISGLTLCRGMGQPGTNYDDPAEVSAISGAAFAIKKALFEQLGGFDERFFLYMEDADLSLRARLAGYRILFTPQSVVLHHYRLRFGKQKIFYQERNRYLMLLKTYHWRTLILLAPTLVLAEIVSWGFILSQERSQIGGKLRAYLWPVRHRRALREDQAATQQLRRVDDRTLLQQNTIRLDYGQANRGFASTAAETLFTPLFRVLKSVAAALL